jgi:uncharacterized protein
MTTMAGQVAEATAPAPSTRHERRPPALDLSPLVPLLARIDAKYHPEQVWLFGSRARGDARPTSDWDILVVVPDDTDERELDPVVAWRLQRGSGVHADVIPCWAREYREDRGTVNTLAYEVDREGVLISQPAPAASASLRSARMQAAASA